MPLFMLLFTSLSNYLNTRGSGSYPQESLFNKHNSFPLFLTTTTCGHCVLHCFCRTVAQLVVVILKPTGMCISIYLIVPVFCFTGIFI